MTPKTMAETEKHSGTSEQAPIDLVRLDADTRWALQITFALPERAAVDMHTLRLTGSLNLLVREGLAEDNPDARRHYRAAYALLAVKAEDLNDVRAWEHCQRLARLARVFAALYRQRRQ
ncbi:hypothetical protein [Streptomyces sp. N35]|uniref:hypothetical protein n=1 Tax=Streptomyces sp. N35 TaxID=2795730 RepID=UPI0018F33537|nr:hypothetical protein [Streptomyces sp. N35]